MSSDNSFKELDQIFFPVLASRQNATPAETALALLARAGDQRHRVAPWIANRFGKPSANRSADRTDKRAAIRDALVSLASSKSWEALVTKAIKFSERNPHDATPVVQRIASRLFLPLPGGSRRNEILLRAAFACIGGLHIESTERDGIDTLLLGSPTLAVQLGVSIPTAKKALIQLAEIGWIKVVSEANGSARRIRIPSMNRHEFALVRERPDLASLVHDSEGLIRLVQHPAFNGSFRAWMWAVSELGGVDPLTLGLNRREIKELSEIAAEMRLTEPVPRDGLDDWADFLELDVKRDAAEAKRVARAAERRVEVMASREVAAKARKGLDTLMAGLGRMPLARSSSEQKADYAIELGGAVREALAQDEAKPALEAAIEREMARRGRAAGWSAEDLELLAA